VGSPTAATVPVAQPRARRRLDHRSAFGQHHDAPRHHEASIGRRDWRRSVGDRPGAMSAAEAVKMLPARS
jgi:hypothetical protein